MATEEKPATEPEVSPEFVYRASDPASMHFREDDGAPVLEGRMMPYNEWTRVHSAVEGPPFMERFAPGALAKTMSERASRIRALFEHGMDAVLGTQPIAEINDMRDETDGAYFRASLLDGLPQLLISGLRRGLYGSSIRFRPVPGKFTRVRSPEPSDHNPEGLPEVTYREAEVREFSVVTFPQYAGATAQIRSITDEITAGTLMKNPERVMEMVNAWKAQAEAARTSEPQHSEPAPVEPEEGPAEVEESRRTPKHDYLSETKEESWRL